MRHFLRAFFVGLSALVVGTTIGSTNASVEIEIPVTDQWVGHPAVQAFNLTGRGLPAALYLVRPRGEHPDMEGILVLGERDGALLVSGAPAAIRGLEQRGWGVTPLREASQARPVSPTDTRSWQTIEQPDPLIAEMVAQVDWEGVSRKIQRLVDFKTRYFRAANHAEVVQSLVDSLASYGFEPAVGTLDDRFGRRMYNVEVVQIGRKYPDSYFIICGHYDSVSGQPTISAPGADDNGTGTSAVLTAAEILSQYDFEYSIRYVCFDAEEIGLYGSSVYASWAAKNELDIVGVLNFDMLGYWEPGVPRDLEIEANHASRWLADAIINAAELYTDAPFKRHVFDGAWWSDHASFWNYGYPAVNHEEAWDWGDPDFSPNYHAAGDDMSGLHPEFTVDNVQVAVAALATLARPYRQQVAFDVRPGSRRNSFDPRSRGVLPALVLGSGELDVRDIDVSSLRLQGTVAPSWAHVVDRGSSGGDNGHRCAPRSADGIPDLLLMFRNKDVAAVLGPVAKGDTVRLVLTGALVDGTQLEGTDVVTIVGRGCEAPLADADLPPDPSTEAVSIVDRSAEISLADAPSIRSYVTRLGAATPNPFNPTTRIPFQLADESHAAITVYDVQGRLIARLVDDVLPAGEHSAVWNAGDRPSGVYFFRLQAGVVVETRKVILLK
jgi:hypothetical protein